jgi:predicted DCC family thiol-disulfide oxidoreductase YuxK
MVGTLTILYDADCGFCAWTVRLLRRLDWRGDLQLIPLARASMPGRPSVDELSESLHVVDPEGRWWAGAEAWLQVATRIPELRALAWLANVPLGRRVIDLGYRLVARNRHRLSALLGLTACNRPRR